MSKYTINHGYGDEREVEASDYEVHGDFIHFYVDTQKVLTLRTGKVYVVERQ